MKEYKSIEWTSNAKMQIHQEPKSCRQIEREIRKLAAKFETASGQKSPSSVET
jgi:uncharacterized coiled-coil DUF342 family protein